MGMGEGKHRFNDSKAPVSPSTHSAGNPTCPDVDSSTVVHASEPAAEKLNQEREDTLVTSHPEGFGSSIGTAFTTTQRDVAADTASQVSMTSGSTLGTRQERTPRQKLVSRIQFGVLCGTLFIVGWNDGSTGPLIPRMRQEYNVGYTVVSVIFVLSCVGFILGALVNVWLTDKVGFGKVLAIGAAMQIVVYSVQAAMPPFPVFAVFNLLNGAGIALQDAQASGFVGSLTRKSSTKMSVVQSFYGLGGFAAPLVSTQFAGMDRWSFHYLVSLGLAVLNFVLLSCTFRFNQMDDCLEEGGEHVERIVKHEDDKKFRQIMTTKSVHLLGFFMLAYVGVGVTIGGWIVTYIIEVRNGGPSSGYIASGYYGGLTVGRILLLPVTKWIGQRRAVFVYFIITLGLEFVIWFVPSLVVNGIMVGLIGIVFGPMYPIAIHQASRILPRHIFLGAVGWIAGFGQAGSAIIPFITGAIAQKHGIKSLNPVVVAMMGVMIVLWWLVPDNPVAASEQSSEVERVEEVREGEKEK